MSFIKGEFYRCINNGNGTIPFTLGRDYECVSGSTDMHAISDNGTFYIASAHRFDRTPVRRFSSNAVTPVGGPPPLVWPTPSPTPAAKKEPMCCGEKPEKKVFSTFEYLFCNKCKNEVGGKANDLKPERTVTATLTFSDIVDATATQADDYATQVAYANDAIKKYWMGS